jgi:glycerol kinase
MKGFAKNWALDTRFKPKMKKAERERKLRGWADAVSRTLTG